jgi:aldehyde dehydrogenase
MKLEQALSSLSAQIKMRERYDNFIGGEWVPPAEGRYFTNLSPISGQPLCEVARSTAADIDKALDAAHAAKAAGGRCPQAALAA